MLLEGSCCCGAVRFRVESPSPYPFNLCYCSICRKTGGGGGYAINLGALSATLEVEGRDHLGVFHARIDGQESPAERHFCKTCGSALWLYDARWPEPGASPGLGNRHRTTQTAAADSHDAGQQGPLGGGEGG